MSIVHTQSASESKSALFSVFHTHATRPKVTSESSSTNASATLGKNQKRSDCCHCFSRMTESGTFDRLSVFPECAIDFRDFLEQIQQSRNGGHVGKKAQIRGY